jgi:hypothetical protein
MAPAVSNAGVAVLLVSLKAERSIYVIADETKRYLALMGTRYWELLSVE